MPFGYEIGGFLEGKWGNNKLAQGSGKRRFEGDIQTYFGSRLFGATVRATNLFGTARGGPMGVRLMLAGPCVRAEAHCTNRKFGSRALEMGKPRKLIRGKRLEIGPPILGETKSPLAEQKESRKRHTQRTHMTALGRLSQKIRLRFKAFQKARKLKQLENCLTNQPKVYQKSLKSPTRSQTALTYQPEVNG